MEPTMIPPDLLDDDGERISIQERIERYRALKDAFAQGQWQQVIDLSADLESYRDVPDRVAQARAALERPRQLQEELTNAYANDEWARVIALGRDLGAALPA